MKKRIKKAFYILIVVLLAMVLTSFVRQPERYLSTWRYQLGNDIARGDKLAIEYYEDNYTSKGIYLFGEN